MTKDEGLMSSHPIVTLLTDFGGGDGYVASMKGVIMSLAPQTQIVDAAHDIPPQDIQAAAWALSQFWSLFPAGTIHVAVVDPGVGTSRKSLCIEADERYLIVPDNGIGSLAAERAAQVRFYKIRSEAHRPGRVSATFHGRDIFAYVAGLLASGKSVSEFADATDSVVRPSWARAVSTATRIDGEVVHVDHFGNLITNIHRRQLGDADWALASVRVGAQVATRVYRTYGDMPEGSLLALFGSSDTLEIAINGRSAHVSLGCGRGMKVTVEKGMLGSSGFTA